MLVIEPVAGTLQILVVLLDHLMIFETVEVLSIRRTNFLSIGVVTSELHERDLIRIPKSQNFVDSNKLGDRLSESCLGATASGESTTTSVIGLRNFSVDPT